MADLNDLTQDVNIWNDAKTKAVTITTDGAKERLDVDANISYQDGAVIVIDNLTRRIWDGLLFETSGLLDLDVNETYDWLVKVDASYDLHINGSFISELGAELYVYEAPTVSANGTAITPLNTNRSSTNTLNSLMYGAPTVTTTGTLIRSMLAPGSNQSSGSGEQTGFIWKHGVDYLIRIVSRGNGNDIGINMYMYERET